jgi:hypothetical protein
MFGVTSAFVVTKRAAYAEAQEPGRCVKLESPCMDDALCRCFRLGGERRRPDRPAGGDPRSNTEIACRWFKPLEPEKIMYHEVFLVECMGKEPSIIAGSGARCNQDTGGVKIPGFVPIMMVQEIMLSASCCIDTDVVAPASSRTQGVLFFLPPSFSSPLEISLRNRSARAILFHLSRATSSTRFAQLPDAHSAGRQGFS